VYNNYGNHFILVKNSKLEVSWKCLKAFPITHSFIMKIRNTLIERKYLIGWPQE